MVFYMMKIIYLQFVLGFTVIRGMAFSGNLNFVSYLANFNSTDGFGVAAGFYSPIIPCRLVVELLNWST